jgi:hypothetical protein
MGEWVGQTDKGVCHATRTKREKQIEREREREIDGPATHCVSPAHIRIRSRRGRAHTIHTHTGVYCYRHGVGVVKGVRRSRQLGGRLGPQNVAKDIHRPLRN